MKISFEGIGQWAATFACGDDVAEGQVVKVSDNGAVGTCAAGDAFCGVAAAVGSDKAACAVVMGGMVTVSYSGSEPALGWSGLSADGAGGVKADTGGQKYVVADVDATGKTVTFAL